MIVFYFNIFRCLVHNMYTDLSFRVERKRLQNPGVRSKEEL